MPRLRKKMLIDDTMPWSKGKGFPKAFPKYPISNLNSDEEESPSPSNTKKQAIHKKFRLSPNGTRGWFIKNDGEINEKRTRRALPKGRGRPFAQNVEKELARAMQYLAQNPPKPPGRPAKGAQVDHRSSPEKKNIETRNKILKRILDQPDARNSSGHLLVDHPLLTIQNRLALIVKQGIVPPAKDVENIVHYIVSEFKNPAPYDDPSLMKKRKRQLCFALTILYRRDLLTPQIMNEIKKNNSREAQRWLQTIEPHQKKNVPGENLARDRTPCDLKKVTIEQYGKASMRKNRDIIIEIITELALS